MTDINQPVREHIEAMRLYIARTRALTALLEVTTDDTPEVRFEVFRAVLENRRPQTKPTFAPSHLTALEARFGEGAQHEWAVERSESQWGTRIFMRRTVPAWYREEWVEGERERGREIVRDVLTGAERLVAEGWI